MDKQHLSDFHKINAFTPIIHDICLGSLTRLQQGKLYSDLVMQLGWPTLQQHPLNIKICLYRKIPVVPHLSPQLSSCRNFYSYSLSHKLFPLASPSVENKIPTHPLIWFSRDSCGLFLFASLTHSSLCVNRQHQYCIHFLTTWLHLIVWYINFIENHSNIVEKLQGTRIYSIMTY